MLLSPTGQAATALAVSCDGAKMTVLSKSKPLSVPTSVQGKDISLKISVLMPSLLRMSKSQVFVSAFTKFVVVALVYSFLISPVNLNAK